MAIITGKDGYVNGVPCTTSWAVNRNASIGRYAASCAGYGTAVNRGVKNVTGVMTGIGGNPPVVPGTNMTFKGVIDNTFGLNKVLDGSVYIQSLAIQMPKEAGGNLTWAANFGVQGDLTEGTTGAADATYVLHEGAVQITDAVLYNGGTPYTIPGFRSANFTINAPEKTYVINGLTHRLPGNLEADISISVYDDDYINSKFEPNAIDKVSLYIDASTFWLFEWVRFGDINNFMVDRATQAIIGYDINGMWTAVSGGVEGSIVKPGGAFLFGS